ncbi:aerobic glycerol-3-phosphate dehydrogenase [Spirochaetota bacterium]|nr:aerobic glycerol-3-phosphate dehydrogenase [Spirochaetota bacterium]
MKTAYYGSKMRNKKSTLSGNETIKHSRAYQFLKLAAMMGQRHSAKSQHRGTTTKTATKHYGRYGKYGKSHLERLEHLDALIVGGGINGAVTAMCLSSYGYKVALVEADDFAGGTSQASSNLIWGGIKYLENFEFMLVRKLSRSRNRLMQTYPSLVRELRFLMPHRRSDEHGLLKLYLGTWFYWMWGGFQTAKPRFHTRRSLKKTGFPLAMQYLTGGFEYSDAYLLENDARFVFNFIRRAEDLGAAVLNYTVLENIVYKPEKQSSATKTTSHAHWQANLYDKIAKKRLAVTAKIIINAAGPHIDAINKANQIRTTHHHVYSKGVHLIVNRLLPDRRALAFYANDGRLFFALPMGNRTCLGTTDTFVKKPAVRVTPADRKFILTNINKLLALPFPLTTKDIIAERCGVRPLVQEYRNAGSHETTAKDWFSLSRKHVIEGDAAKRYISIFGGKLTDCLNVGAEVYEQVHSWLSTQQATVSEGVATRLVVRKEKLKNGAEKTWFGEPSVAQREQFLSRAERLLPEKIASQLWVRYNHHAHLMLDRIEALWHKLTDQAPLPATYLEGQNIIKQHKLIIKAMLRALDERSSKNRHARAFKTLVNRKNHILTQRDFLMEWERLVAPVIVGSDVLMLEAEYVLKHEWVVSIEDFLRRRTMLALTTKKTELARSKNLILLRKILKKALKHP